MRSTQEGEAQQHLRRSAKVFLAAAAAVCFGILFAYDTIGLVSGGGGSLLSNGALWVVLLAGFAIALVATRVWSRPIRQRAG